jgi:hypothetical protein
LPLKRAANPDCWRRARMKRTIKRSSILFPSGSRIEARRNRAGYRIGRLDDEDITRLNRAMMIHLGLAG